MSRFNILPVILALIGIFTAAFVVNPVESELQQYGSDEDVREFLKQNGIEVNRLECKTPSYYPDRSPVRGLTCQTILSHEQLSTLKNRVPLNSAPPTLFVKLFHACETTPGFRSTDSGVDVFLGKNTRVPNGVSRIEFHVVPVTGAVCIEIDYG